MAVAAAYRSYELQSRPHHNDSQYGPTFNRTCLTNDDNNANVVHDRGSTTTDRDGRIYRGHGNRRGKPGRDSHASAGSGRDGVVRPAAHRGVADVGREQCEREGEAIASGQPTGR